MPQIPQDPWRGLYKAEGISAPQQDSIQQFAGILADLFRGLKSAPGSPAPATTAGQIGAVSQLPLTLGMALGGMPRPDASARFQTLVKAAQQGDQAARDELVQGMSKILWSVANRYGRSERSFGGQKIEPQVSSRDLYGRGVEEILKTLPKYKEGEKGFIGWSYPKIVGAMKKEALGARTPVAISPDVLAAMRKLDAAEQKLRAQLGPYVDITDEQLVKVSGLKPDIVARVRSGELWRHPAPQAAGLEKAEGAVDPTQPGARIMEQESFGQLKDLFRTLPTEMKPFLEAEEAGKSAKDAAAAMGIPLRTYQRRVKEAQDFWKGMVEIHNRQISGGSDKPLPGSKLLTERVDAAAMAPKSAADTAEAAMPGLAMTQEQSRAALEQVRRNEITLEELRSALEALQGRIISGGSYGPSSLPFQERMRQTANERIERINEVNARFGIPPIKRESRVAPETPFSGKQPEGGKLHMGMSGKRDARQAREEQAIIQDMLSGGAGDIPGRRSPRGSIYPMNLLDQLFPPRDLGAAAAKGRDPFRDQPIWDPENLRPLIKSTTRPYYDRKKIQGPRAEEQGFYTGQFPHKPEPTLYPTHLFGQTISEGPAAGYNPESLRHGELKSRIEQLFDTVKMSSGRN